MSTLGKPLLLMQYIQAEELGHVCIFNGWYHRYVGHNIKWNGWCCVYQWVNDYGQSPMPVYTCKVYESCDIGGILPQEPLLMQQSFIWYFNQCQIKPWTMKTGVHKAKLLSTPETRDLDRLLTETHEHNDSNDLTTSTMYQPC